jgi:RNA polymerase sigma-70 factor (ECF subfamily)
MSELTLSDVPATDSTVSLAAAGDEAAFARLVDRHHASMAKVAFAVCGDGETARDATQQAWEIAWRRLPTLRDPAQVRSWLVAIAANEARQAVRRRRTRIIVDLSERLDAASGADPAEHIATVDLARVLATLTPDDRALLAMRFLAGLDATEIASGLHLSPSGVRSRLARLIERLRMELDHA